MKTAALPLFLVSALLVACGEKPPEKKGAPPTLITTTTARAAPLAVVERTVGTLEALVDPQLGAEVAGKVVDVLARAGDSVKAGQLLARIDATDAGNQAEADRGEIARLEALLAQQERLWKRQSELVQKNFISRNALDDVTAQRDALKNQLATARAKAAISRNSVGKTRVVAPVAGVIQTQIVTVGDYVKVGDPLFRLVSNQKLMAHLPFPETAAPRIKVGMPVILNSPLAPEAPIRGVVADIRPTLGDSSRAIDVTARLDNPGPLKGGGTLDAAVVTSRRDDAILVPEQAVVLRPAGKVVYLIADGKASQQVVEVGSKDKGMVEIVKGLKGGETLALDGAGFLTQGATVAIKAPPPAKPAAVPNTPAAPAAKP